MDILHDKNELFMRTEILIRLTIFLPCFSLLVLFFIKIIIRFRLT